MATTPTTYTTPKHTSPIWIVSIDGNSPTEVAAETCEITDAGILVFSTDKKIVRAVAAALDDRQPTAMNPKPA